MSSGQHTESGGGWFSKLVVVALLAVAIGLYLRIVMVDQVAVDAGSSPQVSVRVVEDGAPEVATAGLPAAAVSQQPLRPLPEDQMALIQRVFAPGSAKP